MTSLVMTRAQNTRSDPDADAEDRLVSSMVRPPVPEARHFGDLQDARTVGTAAFLRTQAAIADLGNRLAVGAIYGPAGAGKTFAVQTALAVAPHEPVYVYIPVRPSLKQLMKLLLRAVTGVSHEAPRIKLGDDLRDALAVRPIILVLDEAQHLAYEAIEALRGLHDDPETKFALVFCGGVGCEEVLRRYPMLRNRVTRWVEFSDMKDKDAVEIARSFHPIYAEADTVTLLTINQGFAHGVFRDWAAFTVDAVEICSASGISTVDDSVVTQVIARMRGGRAAI